MNLKSLKIKMIKKLIRKLTENAKVKCEFCKTSLKRKNAHIKKVKRLEFVHPVKTTFCNKNCCKKYNEYELSAPRKPSLCSMCPVHPEAV